MQEIQTYVEMVEGELVIKQEPLERLKELTKKKKEIESELKTLSNSITNELKEKCTSTTKINDYNFIVKGGFYDFTFDLETFKKENLELYVKYLVPHQSPITYALVSATREKKNEKD